MACALWRVGGGRRDREARERHRCQVTELRPRERQPTATPRRETRDGECIVCGVREAELGVGMGKSAILEESRRA